MKFQLPTTIMFGSGLISKLGEVVNEELHAFRPLLITDQGIMKSGIARKVLGQLPKIRLFDEIEPNPKYTTVNRAGMMARQEKPDLVIGFGGGSSLDAAKAVALLATNEGNIEDYEGKEKYKVSPLPMVAVPTTCGTGSEVTWVSVVTHTRRRFKMSIKGPEMFPKVALIDPDLLSSLPPHLVASTGIDALTHAIEAYTVKQATLLTDIFARHATELIFHYIQRAYKDIKTDQEARRGMMFASTIAGIAFGNSDVGSVHCLAESVGALYDIPHGVANSIFLPYVMEFNFPLSKTRYADLAEVSGINGENTTQRAQALIERIKSLCQSLNIPSLRELGISKSQFSRIAQKSFENNSNASNPRQANAEDYLAILEKAFKVF